MNNYNLTTALKDYAIVGESVVKLTQKKPLAYWMNTATGSEIGIEHTKQETIFRRKLASGFIKMLDSKMVKRFNAAFGQKQLMESLVNNVVIGELSGYPKALWGTFLLEWMSQPQTGLGFDYIRQTGVSFTYADGNVRLLYDPMGQGGDIFQLYCDNADGSDGVVPNGTLAKLRLSFCSINYDAPSDLTPTIQYFEFDTQIANGSQGFSIPINSDVPVGFPDTYTYLLARIEFLSTNAKGLLKSLNKGEFDTLQVVGVRF